MPSRCSPRAASSSRPRCRSRTAGSRRHRALPRRCARCSPDQYSSCPTEMIGLVLDQIVGAEPVRIDAGNVRDVVAVLLQEVDRRIVGAEQIVLRAGRGAAAVAGQERTVVADGVGAVLRAEPGIGDILMIDSAARIAVEIPCDLDRYCRPSHYRPARSCPRSAGRCRSSSPHRRRAR